MSLNRKSPSGKLHLVLWAQTTHCNGLHNPAAPSQVQFRPMRSYKGRTRRKLAWEALQDTSLIFLCFSAAASTTTSPQCLDPQIAAAKMPKPPRPPSSPLLHRRGRRLRRCRTAADRVGGGGGRCPLGSGCSTTTAPTGSRCPRGAGATARAPARAGSLAAGAPLGGGGGGAGGGREGGEEGGQGGRGGGPLRAPPRRRQA